MIFGFGVDEDFCILPADVGSCRNETSSIRRYFYDVRRGTCLEFSYSGCGGNLNNFDDYESCMGHCQHRRRKLDREYVEIVEGTRFVFI
jgi:hypothetical protein